MKKVTSLLVLLLSLCTTRPPAVDPIQDDGWPTDTSSVLTMVRFSSSGLLNALSDQSLTVIKVDTTIGAFDTAFYIDYVPQKALLAQ